MLRKQWWVIAVMGFDQFLFANRLILYYEFFLAVISKVNRFKRCRKKKEEYTVVIEIISSHVSKYNPICQPSNKNNPTLYSSINQNNQKKKIEQKNKFSTRKNERQLLLYHLLFLLSFSVFGILKTVYAWYGIFC